MHEAEVRPRGQEENNGMQVCEESLFHSCPDFTRLEKVSSDASVSEVVNGKMFKINTRAQL